MEEDKVRMEESAFYFPILLQIIRMTDLSDVEPHTELLTILTDTSMAQFTQRTIMSVMAINHD